MGQKISAYEEYVTAEWEMFLADDSRRNALLKSVEEIEVRRVLDIGCGAGQEMLPFVAANASGFGVDIDPRAGRVGRAMFARAGHAENVSFLTAKGGELPFENASFDFVICRVAL